MGKITEALKRVAQERLERIERMDKKGEVKYEFIARKKVESNIDPRIVTVHDPDSPVAEQYRMLRTNFQAINSKSPLKAVAITSSTHSEGKTITAINLAITMAKDFNNKNILLVDADLRRAKICKYLGVEADKGLSDLITNGLAIDDALLDIGIKNLAVLPAGKALHNPAELLGSDKVRNLISQLKTRYDYIIFDTPPIISVTDAGVLGAQTDGVIMAIQANRTQKGVVKHAEALLRQAHVKIIGYVLTNIQYHIPAYIYRYL